MLTAGGMMDVNLLGKCGFYCGACPTYINKECGGCVDAHTEGDCFSRDCVMRKELKFCGECKEFPCDMILTQQHCTVLDKDWLLWKKNSNTNR